MVYCKADAAYVRISSDNLWKIEEEVIIVECKNELYEYLLKIFHEEKNTGWKTVADG